jgi:hypothetical protein
VVFALHFFFYGTHHVVAQVVKTKFVVGTKRDVAFISGDALF